MSNRSVSYPSTSYKGKHVQIFVSPSIMKFLNLPNEKIFKNEIIKGLQASTAAAMESVKRQIQSMDAVWSGFMRSNITGWVDTTRVTGGNKIYSYIGTRAWYDILVHEGLGIHARPKQKTPSAFLPNEIQKAIAPKWEDSKKLGKHKKGGGGPRPFITRGISAAQSEIIGKMGMGYLLGVRNVVQSASQIPTHRLSKLFRK